MPDRPNDTPCFTDACRRLAARATPVHGAALAGVVVAAFGLAGLRSIGLPGPAPIADGERLRIEVVAPIEPKVSPGAVMEVGELVDGLTHIPRPAPPEPMPAEYAYAGEDWDAELPPMPPRRFHAEEPASPATPPSEPRTQRSGGWFGFDEPRRDYQAERDARRARLDAMERRDRQREQAWRDRRDRELDRRREPRPPPRPYWD